MNTSIPSASAPPARSAPSATSAPPASVREALLRLEAEGLVRLYPKKGALVVPVSAQEAHDVVEARALIEEWAAERAWARRDEIVPRLEPLLEEMRRARAAEAFLD